MKRISGRSLFVVLLSFGLSAFFVQSAGAADPLVVVNAAGRFESCGPEAPAGCEHVPFRGDPQVEAFHKVYRFPAGWVFPQHWHIAAENLVMIRGTLKVNSDGGSERTLRTGDYVYIPAHLVHWGSCPEDCEFYLGVEGPDSFNVLE